MTRIERIDADLIWFYTLRRPLAYARGTVSSKTKPHSRLDSSTRHRRGRLPEEGRCQDARKSDLVHVIEEVRGLDEELSAESFFVRAGRHRTHSAQHLAAVRAPANDAHLRAAHALVIRLLAETEAPAQTRADIPLSRAARAVATDACRAVVDGEVFVVVKAGGDVVRTGGVGVEDRAEAERFRQSEVGKDVEAAPRVLKRRAALAAQVEIVRGQAQCAVRLVGRLR